MIPFALSAVTLDPDARLEKRLYVEKRAAELALTHLNPWGEFLALKRAFPLLLPVYKAARPFAPSKYEWVDERRAPTIDVSELFDSLTTPSDITVNSYTYEPGISRYCSHLSLLLLKTREHVRWNEAINDSHCGYFVVTRL